MKGLTPVKICLVGDDGVGKTSLIITWTTNAGRTEEPPYIVEGYGCNLLAGGLPHLVSIMDSGGSSDYDKQRPLSYPGTDIFFVCYSIGDRKTLESVKTKWIPELREHAPGIPFYLLGLKQEWRNDRYVPEGISREDFVTEEEGKAMANEIGAAKYVEVGLTNRHNLKHVWEAACMEVYVAPKPKKNTCTLF